MLLKDHHPNILFTSSERAKVGKEHTRTSAIIRLACVERLLSDKNALEISGTAHDFETEQRSERSAENASRLGRVEQMRTLAAAHERVLHSVALVQQQQQLTDIACRYIRRTQLV